MTAAEAPQGPLLVDQLRFMAARWPDEVAYRDIDADAAITFREWDQQSSRAARWLVDRGVEKGDRVALYMDSNHCLPWITTYAAIHKAGAVMVPVNTRLEHAEVHTILRHAEPSAIVTNRRLLNITQDVGAHLDVKNMLAVDAHEADGVDDWSIINGYDAGEIQVPLDADDMADIMYTSGTTGLPKGVLVRHRNVAMMPNGVPAWSGRGWLHGAPLFTFAGMSFIYNPMKLGLAGLYMPKFDVEKWFDIVERERPMMIFLVPAMAELITANPRFEDADLSGPIAVSIGSAPLAPATLAKLQERMPSASVVNSYGLTEAGPAYITMPPEEAERRVGWVGRPMPPMEVRVVDAET